MDKSCCSEGLQIGLRFRGGKVSSDRLLDRRAVTNTVPFLFLISRGTDRTSQLKEIEQY